MPNLPPTDRPISTPAMSFLTKSGHRAGIGQLRWMSSAVSAESSVLEKAIDDDTARFSVRAMTGTVYAKQRKSGLRQMRRQGNVLTAVLQGGVDFPDRMMTVPAAPIKRDFELGRFVQRQKSMAAFSGPLYDLTVVQNDLESGQSVLVERIRAYAKQLRVQPLTEEPLALGLVRAPVHSQISVELPIAIINREKCEALKNGFMMDLVKSIRVRVDSMSPAPQCVWLDLSSRGYGTINADQLLLPPNCKLLEDNDNQVLKIGKKP